VIQSFKFSAPGEPLIWVELHQRAKGKREEENLMGWREVSQWLDFDDACWAEAAKTARACLQAGINVPF
jgi:hypothetical protein